MIPANQYDPKLANDLLWYLIQELRRTMQDRGTMESFWARWEALYRARPAEDKKDFPFVGASNLVVPIAATDVDTLYARMMGLLFEPENLWSVYAQRPELVDFAAATQEFLRWAQDNELKPYKPVGNYLLEKHKLGTSLLKTRYTREMQKVYEWREMEGGQTWQQQSVVMLKDHPDLNHVRLWDFFIPAGFPLIQQAPWVAERVRMTYQQFMNRVKAGIYTNADKIGAYFFNPPINRVQQIMDGISNYKPSVNSLIEFYEFWINFDIDGDGWDEALVCTIHLDSQTYVRLDYNPFFNQEKPYSAGNFMRDPNSFYGIGLCEMLDNFQEEITALHNQRIDNGTVMLSQMWAVKKENMNIRLDEPIYPGKIWRLNDPKDIVAMPLGVGMGTAMTAAMELESSTRSEAQRRTGVNDWVAANMTPSMGYSTAFTTQQMIAQSTKRFGETLRETRSVLSECGTRILELYQQYNPRGKPFVALGQKDGMLANVVLKFPLDLIRKGLAVSVTAIDANMGKDSQIRNTTLVYQQLTQYYMNYMQMLSYVANPQMPPQIKQVAIVAAEGTTVLMRRLMQLYDQQDYDRLLPELDGGASEQQRQLANIQAILQSAQLGGGAQAGPGQPGVPAGPQGAPGVPGILPQNPTIYGPGALPAGQNPVGYSGSVSQSGRPF